jgi:hypothetical protein
VHINRDGIERGIGPIASGSSLHTRVMKTEALKQALDLSRLRRGLRRRAARRGKKSRRSGSFPSDRKAMSGTPATRSMFSPEMAARQILALAEPGPVRGGQAGS